MGRSSRARSATRKQRELEAARLASIPSPSALTKWQRYRWAILKATPLGVLLPMTFFLGSVGPDDFSRNYANWARTFGLAEWADWLTQYATAPRVFVAAILVSFVYLVVAFLIPVIIRRTKENTAAVLVPLTIAVILVIVLLGQNQLSAEPDRHVLDWQKEKLKELLGPEAGIFRHSVEVAAADNAESRGYAIEIMRALLNAGLNVATADRRLLIPRTMRPMGTGVKGVFMALPPNTTTIPSEAAILLKALNEAGITTTIYQNVDYWNDNYNITVGLK